MIKLINNSAVYFRQLALGMSTDQIKATIQNDASALQDLATAERLVASMTPLPLQTFKLNAWNGLSDQNDTVTLVGETDTTVLLVDEFATVFAVTKKKYQQRQALTPLDNVRTTSWH